MRRALLPLLPAWSRIYGLHPWDVDSLTRRELSEYLADYDQL